MSRLGGTFTVQVSVLCFLVHSKRVPAPCTASLKLFAAFSRVCAYSLLALLLDGPYGNFAGRDASRGMAKQSFDEGTFELLWVAAAQVER